MKMPRDSGCSDLPVTLYELLPQSKLSTEIHSFHNLTDCHNRTRTVTVHLQEQMLFFDFDFTN